MKRTRLYAWALSLLVSLLASMPNLAQAQQYVGAVYAMTNPHLRPNEIVVYGRAEDGILTLVGKVETWGLGYVIAPNDALGSQGALILSPDHRWLFAVNAGSNTITQFGFADDVVTPLWMNTVGSGGDFPVSLTFHNHLLYILNAGGPDCNVALQGQAADGSIYRLPAGTSLGDDCVNFPGPDDLLNTPAQVGFNPQGDQLVVTLKGVGLDRRPMPKIFVFGLDGEGLPSKKPVVTKTNVPFGFVFDALGNLLVTEPFGSSSPFDPNATSAVSSYEVREDGKLEPISATVRNGQVHTCWIAITSFRELNFGYTSNPLSNNISSYRVFPNGRLLLLEGVAAETGIGPVDLAVTPDNRYLYNVNAGDGTIGMFAINQDTGGLTPLGAIGGLPDDGSAVGIAAR